MEDVITTSWFMTFLSEQNPYPDIQAATELKDRSLLRFHVSGNKQKNHGTLEVQQQLRFARKSPASLLKRRDQTTFLIQDHIVPVEIPAATRAW